MTKFFYSAVSTLAVGVTGVFLFAACDNSTISPADEAALSAARTGVSSDSTATDSTCQGGHRGHGHHLDSLRTDSTEHHFPGDSLRGDHSHHHPFPGDSSMHHPPMDSTQHHSPTDSTQHANGPRRKHGH